MMRPEFQFRAYPNPSGGRFRLEIEASAAANAQLDIRDLFGRQLSLLQLNLQAGMNTVDGTQLPVLQTGHYFVTLITPENTQTIRLIRR